MPGSLKGHRLINECTDTSVYNWLFFPNAVTWDPLLEVCIRQRIVRRWTSGYVIDEAEEYYSHRPCSWILVSNVVAVMSSLWLICGPSYPNPRSTSGYLRFLQGVSDAVVFPYCLLVLQALEAHVGFRKLLVVCPVCISWSSTPFASSALCKPDKDVCP